MSIIKQLSIRYLVLAGEHKDRICSPRGQKSDPPGSTTLVFVDRNQDEFAIIPKGLLSALALPGWQEDITERTFDLETYWAKKRGGGSNMVLEQLLAQPRALRFGHVLATGEQIMESPRRGFNSSVLLRLGITGWVELAPRLPLALEHNENFKFPAQLAAGEKLATGCVIVKDPECRKINWTTIFLDREDCDIEVPSCIPLALW